MAKKKKQSTESPSNLKTLIKDHSLFFDTLVDLIPPRFYLSPNDEEEKPWYPGLSKSQRAAFKKQTIENTKKSRRARLDPEKSVSTNDVLKEKAGIEKREEREIGVDKSVTYEELRERLHRRLEELRSNRNTRSDNGKKEKRKRDDEMDTKKEKKVEEKTSASEISSGHVKVGEGKKRKKEGNPKENETVKKNKKNKQKKAEEDKTASVDLSFGQVKIGDETKKKKKKKLTKAQELEKVKRIEEKKNDPEKGEKISKKYSWKTAVDRAAGVKVHDDAKLLKESIKKEKRKRQKSAQKWKERAETREKQMAEKQKKRSDNIKERIHQTKLKKIEKREKKLMRPGFEGRKEGPSKSAST